MFDLLPHAAREFANLTSDTAFVCVIPRGMSLAYITPYRGWNGRRNAAEAALTIEYRAGLPACVAYP